MNTQILNKHNLFMFLHLHLFSLKNLEDEKLLTVYRLMTGNGCSVYEWKTHWM